MLRITLVKSTAKSLKAHKNAVKGLGLRRLHSSVEREDNPRIRGLINCASHLLKVEQTAGQTGNQAKA